MSKAKEGITEDKIISVISDVFIPELPIRLVKTEPYSSAVWLVWEETLKLATNSEPLNTAYLIFVLPISIASNIVYLPLYVFI